MNTKILEIMWKTMNEVERGQMLKSLSFDALSQRLSAIGLDRFAEDPQEMFETLTERALEGFELKTNLEDELLMKVNSFTTTLFSNEEMLMEVVRPRDERALMDFALQVCRMNVWGRVELKEKFTDKISDVLFDKLEDSLKAKGVEFIKSNEEFKEVFENTKKNSLRAYFQQTSFCDGVVSFEEFDIGMQVISEMDSETKVFAEALLKVYARPVGALVKVEWVTGAQTHHPSELDPLKNLVMEGLEWLVEKRDTLDGVKLHDQTIANITSFYAVLQPGFKAVCKAATTDEELKKMQQKTVDSFARMACKCGACELQITLAQELGFEVEKKW